HIRLNLPGRNELRLRRVGHIDRDVPVVGAEHRRRAVVREPVGRPKAFVPSQDRGGYRLDVWVDAYGPRGKKLWVAAIPRYVVNVDLGAVLGTGCQQLASLVNLERLPRIEHCGRREICGAAWLGRIGDIDRAHAEVRPWKCGVRRGPRRSMVGAG